MKIIQQAKGPSIAKSRAEAIDTVLSFLFLSEEKSDWSWLDDQMDRGLSSAVVHFNRLPLTHFDGADISLMYESLMNSTSYQQGILMRIDEEKREVPVEWREQLLSLSHVWDYCFGGYFPEAPGLFPDIKAGYLFSLVRYRTVPLKEVRGLFRLRSSFVVEQSDAHLFNDGTYRSSREYLQYFSGAWHCVGVPFELDGLPMVVDPVGQMQPWLCRSHALTREYDWSVHIGFNVKSVPTVSIPSDPVSARDVFKLRDVPPGKSRREALRHWVSGHYRKTLEANYAETYIWPYLRGAEEFTWQGLYCKIQPSEYDLKKAAEYQKMRGKHAGLVV